jgi:zinc finger CCCH domain-containing protein 13
MDINIQFLGSEPGRRDREDRDRPRSPTRQRDSSASRRDRDRDDRDRRIDRDEHKRDRDDHHRRDRDDVNSDEDPRRWRDDGKRDERASARRDRELRERERDREDKHGDRRWTATEGDSRSKRPAGRERRGGAEETKDRDDRRDREREREKEKEPAWMDTYIPNTPGGGILGGKSADGDLDGIQAWKKGMKEKEMKEQMNAAVTESSALEPGELKRSPDNSEPSAPAPGASDSSLDEIQLFKLIMMREGEKKKTGDSIDDSLLTEASGMPPTQTSSGIHTPADRANGAYIVYFLHGITHMHNRFTQPSYQVVFVRRFICIFTIPAFSWEYA